MKSKYFASPKPRLLAHRGYCAKYPENTLVSFEKALTFTSYLETDLWATADRIPVLHHDEDLQRSCGVNKKIRDLTWAELKKLPLFGSDQTIPSLEVAQKKFPEAYWNIEIKDDRTGIEAEVLKILEKTNSTPRTLIAAEKDSIMLRFRELAPHVPTSAAFNEMITFVQWLTMGAKGPHAVKAKAFQIPVSYENMRLDEKGLIEAAHHLGVEIHYWTVNDPAEVKRLLDLGADGIVTDDPEGIRKIL